MPGGPIGGCWEVDSWDATAWEADAWQDFAAVPVIDTVHLEARYELTTDLTGAVTMPLESPITLFLGTDRQFRVHVLNADGSAAVDITGWALSFKIKAHAADPDTRAYLSKDTAGGAVTIAGTFDSGLLVNTQRATVAIDDTDTDDIPLDRGVWELKRTDAGFETVLAYGPVTFIRSIHGT